MKQLTMGAILKEVKRLKESGMTDKEIAALPVYIGRDDELNGIHTGWYINLLDVNNEDDAGFIELINEDRVNIPITDRAILIS